MTTNMNIKTMWDSVMNENKNPLKNQPIPTAHIDANAGLDVERNLLAHGRQLLCFWRNSCGTYSANFWDFHYDPSVQKG